MVTSGWSKIDEETGSLKEGELREGFWADMLDRGSHMSRFHGDRDSALMLVSQLLQKKSVVLQMQRELVEDSKDLKDTAAGAYPLEDLETWKEEHQRALEGLEELRRDPKLEAGGIPRVETELAKEVDQLASLSRYKIVNDVKEKIDRQSKRSRFFKAVSFI